MFFLCDRSTTCDRPCHSLRVGGDISLTGPGLEFLWWLMEGSKRYSIVRKRQSGRIECIYIYTYDDIYIYVYLYLFILFWTIFCSTCNILYTLTICSSSFKEIQWLWQVSIGAIFRISCKSSINGYTLDLPPQSPPG